MSDPLDPLVLAIQGARQTGERELRLGEVTNVTGGVFVKFDGEGAASTKPYKRLGSYTAVVGDRVLLGRVGPTWVVLGKIVT